MASIVSTLETLLGSAAVIAGETLPPPWSTRLQGVFASPETLPCLVMPESIEALEAVMDCATKNQWSVLPVGQGLHLRWGKPSPPVTVLLSTQRLNQCIEHAQGDLTLTVQAGITLGEIQRQLQHHRQFLPLQSTYGDSSTVGGVVATADSGSLRHRYGGVRDLLLGIEFVRSDGQRAKAGGRVVKNVAGYDLMKLFTGSYGSLGILTQATFRLYPQPEHHGTIILWGNTQGIATVFQTLFGSALTPVAVDLLNRSLIEHLIPQCGLKGDDLALAVQFASMEAAVASQLQTLHTWGQGQHLQGMMLNETEAQDFWHRLPCPGGIPQHPRIRCKIAVLPHRAAETLNFLNHLHDLAEGTVALGLIHGGSGLGWLEIESPTPLRSPVLGAIRQHCQERGGFLTLLDGPVFLKQQLDVWGYLGNALPVMAKVKEAFDPDHRLSPQRFVV